MSKGLRIASNLILPLDAVTEVFGILARRGSGKTYTAKVMAEEMIAAGAQVGAIDPVGVWWGLRSSADGNGEGLPVVIFGGDHADVPLDPATGEQIANLVVEHDFNFVLDLSLLRKGEQRHFLTDFFETLYRRNRDPLHLMLDEADAYAPQRPVKGGERLLGSVEDVVRRGRARGLGMTLITQRPASIHKDVLTQISTLVAMRVTGPHDVRALDEWVKLHAQGDDRQTFLDSLASLKTGEAWFWSPEYLDLFTRVKVRQAKTFDSSATPKAGESRIEPTARKPVDLDDVRQQLAAVIEKVEADDPKTLRRRIAELEREVAQERAAVPATVVEEVEIPVLTPDVIERLDTAVRELDAVVDKASSIRDEISEHLEQWDPLATSVRVTPAVAASMHRPPARPRRSQAGVSGGHVSASQVRLAPAGTAAAAPSDADPDVTLKKGARKMLQTLARPPGIKLTRVQVGSLSGIAHTGGTFRTYLGILQRNGLIDEAGDMFVITDAGLAALGDEIPQAPRTPEEVRDMWMKTLKAGARRMLDVLIDAYPHWTTTDQLGERAEVEPSGGTFRTYLGTLRRNGLADVNGDEIRAADALFIGDGR